MKINFIPDLQFYKSVIGSNHGISWNCLGTVQVYYELKIKNIDFHGEEHVEVQYTLLATYIHMYVEHCYFSV